MIKCGPANISIPNIVESQLALWFYLLIRLEHSEELD